MPGKSHKTNEAETGACFDDDLLYRYLEKMTTQEEEERIELHLNECNNCFADVTALTEIIQAPITEAEKIEIARSRQTTPQEQVDEILKYVEDDRAVTVEMQSAEELPAPDPFTVRQVVSILLALWRRRRLQFVFASVGVFVLMSGSYLGVSYYNTSSHIQQAERLLKDNYQVFFEDVPRLAGGYETTGINMLMAGEDSTASTSAYLKQASALATTALQSGWKGDHARQLLAKISIIEKNYAAANSLLRQLRPQAAKSAAGLNDSGVLYFEQAQWDSAAQYFAAATAAEPQFAEALYNLALTKAKLGIPAEAIALLDEYMKIEKNEGWLRAAREFQKTQRRLNEK